MIQSPPRQRAPATPVRPAVPAHQAAYRKKIADETIAADTALAAAHTAKRTAASQRLSGIKHRRPSQSAPLIRSKISMTAAEWRRVTAAVARVANSYQGKTRARGTAARTDRGAGGL